MKKPNYLVKSLPSIMKLMAKSAVLFAAASVIFILLGNPLKITLIGALILWVVLFVLLLITQYFAIQKARPYLDVYFEKGLCDEYAQEFKRIEIDERKNASEYNKLRLASIYIALERFDAAEAIYNNSTVFTNPNSSPMEKRLFYNDLMALRLAQFRTQEAAQIYNECSIFMGEQVLKNISYRNTWNSNYLTLLFQQGRVDEAMAFWQNTAMKDTEKDNTKILFLASIAAGMLLNGREQEAQEYECQARELAETSDKYEMPWQKEYMHHFIDREIARVREHFAAAQ